MLISEDDIIRCSSRREGQALEENLGAGISRGGRGLARSPLSGLLPAHCKTACIPPHRHYIACFYCFIISFIAFIIFIGNIAGICLENSVRISRFISSSEGSIVLPLLFQLFRNSLYNWGIVFCGRRHCKPKGDTPVLHAPLRRGIIGHRPCLGIAAA